MRRNGHRVNVIDIFHGLADAAALEPLLLLALLLAVGGAIGSLRIGSFSLGPAAVLFTALAFSAFDERLRISREIGIFGLALFAFVVGIGAGPSFFTSIRSGGKALGAVILTLLCAAAVTVAVARAVGLSGPLLSGIYAGALTNTPALAAASQMWNSDLPTVGYSVTYLFGVLGMLIGTMLALKTTAPAGASADMSSPQVPQLDTATVRIEVEGLPDLQTLSERYDHHIIFSRIMRGDRPGHPGVVDLATDSAVPVPGDIVTVIGDVDRIAQFVQDVGHLSSVALTLDRSSLDYRRIAVSNPKVCGIPIGELRLPRRFGATATRIRRGDVDVLATDDLTLQIGDRVRVVAPPSKLKDVARF